MADTDRTSLAGLLLTVNADAIAAFRMQSLLTNCVNTRDAKGSDTVKFYTMAVPAAASAHTAGASDITAGTVTVSSVSLTPAAYVVRVTADQEAFDRGDPAAMQAIGKHAGGAIARGLDTAITAILDDFTNTVGSAGTVTPYTDIIKGKFKLETVGYVGNIAIVLHPGQWSEIYQDVTATQTPAANDELIREGRIMGRFMGADWYVSPWVTVDGSGDATGSIHYTDWGVCCAFDTGPNGTELVNIRGTYEPAAHQQDMNFYSNMAVDTLADKAGVGVIGDVTDAGYIMS